ncbi:flagellar basal body rod protein FlgB [Stratiformator vulcanicus]|uniref:Flagellar basal body rod protein FlgB n=1 Tax=Stratiformator vulcanicus TaxID=2527980 RepID=A0A517R5A4_9PLAN|nr:flagellar basal body rod protein FlgB [Stratiformator vulcanicus]QDT39064.1 Flagellar basal body rod protein FlgB [Stratiformator vulcanicus]
MSFGLTGESMQLLEHVASFAERRHEVLAGNVANIDTPNYKTRDLDVAGFQNALQAALSTGRDTTPSLGQVGLSTPSLTELFSPELNRPREIAPPNVTFQDGNNRSIEREVMEMTKNSMLQTFAVELMSAQAGLLQSVIAERP